VCSGKPDIKPPPPPPPPPPPVEPTVLKLAQRKESDARRRRNSRSLGRSAFIKSEMPGGGLAIGGTPGAAKDE
jgi:hypothetical protein